MNECCKCYNMGLQCPPESELSAKHTKADFLLHSYIEVQIQQVPEMSKPSICPETVGE